jgi:hypothetical protein
MSKPQRKKQAQAKIARLEIVASLYKRCFSVRQIQSEVMKRLDLNTYSLSTVHKDIHTLLDEWRESRIEDIDAALQLELERIDDTVRELWSQWEKSKEDYIRTSKTRRGAPKTDKKTNETKIETFGVEDYSTNVVALGNPAYISEIRQQLAERRKLLGLYAPEKKDIRGDVSFSQFLIESGLIDEAEKQANPETPSI